LNPFDIKAVLFAKHAQHVVLIHFPIALFIVAALFDFLAQATKRSVLAAVAYYNLLGAAISAIPVVATGVLAWRFQLQGQKLKGVLLMHLLLGWTSMVLIWVAWVLHRRSRNQFRQSIPFLRLGFEVLAVGVVMLTAHLGGFPSGVNGPG
jgi:uncharacterized membrane protein